MQRMLPILVLLTVSLASPARAEFHFWDVSEVYTSADQSVQFIEFSTTFGDQQFLGAHQIQSRVGGTAQETFTIPGNLPVGQGQSTANRRFLVATPGFEAVAGISPDYVLPGNPIFIPIGVVDEVILVGADSLSLVNLPTDDLLSLLGDGVTTAVPTPTNFAGEVGTIDLPEPAAGAVGAMALIGLLGVRRARPVD